MPAPAADLLQQIKALILTGRLGQLLGRMRPVADRREGRVIGVCDWKPAGGGNEGLGFAVGAESIRKILNP
jgi:hypothetical protein